MAYRLDFSAPFPPGEALEATVVLVGCGGTGAFLAEAVARLLGRRRAELYLVDSDRVERHNLGRQAFEERDRGRFKAEVLAERLARRAQLPVGYSVCSYDAALHARAFGRSRSRLKLLLGCVDNAAARRSLAATLEQGHRARSGVVWLDCGNGRNSGQVLLGNVTRADGLRGAFDRAARVCRALPAPSLQRPDLLDAPPEPADRPDCAEAVRREEQGATVNQMVAALAATLVEKLLSGTCTWMGAYVDLEDGLLRVVPADPRLVARVAGLHLNAVAPPAARRGGRA